MRFFSYQGTDGQGRPTQGTIMAPSAAEAGNLLAGAGVRIASVQEVTAGAPRPAPAPRPAMVSTPAPRASVSTPVAPARPAPTPTPASPAVATQVKERDAGNKTSAFFFESLGRYLRSGVAPNRALEELGQRARKAWLGDRLLYASQAVGKGASLADALDACRCFPTGSVGTIRAGEASGALPDACFQAAMGCEQAHKLNIRCGVMSILFIFIALYLPVGTALVRGGVDSMETQADANGTLPIWGTFLGKVWLHLKGAIPFIVAWWTLVIGAWRLWLTPRMRRARHRAVVMAPILAGRAREESLARVAWALTELSRAGLSPVRALRVASDAAPNLVIADRFREEAARMREHDKLSAAMRATGLLDPQLVDIVENGELAGDVPGAVGSVYRTTAAEFERRDSTTHTKIWYVLLPILAVITVAIVYHFFKAIIEGEIHAMLKDT